MNKRKEPKYNIGDTVVITIYGTVGKITNIKWLDEMYVYEVNKSEGLFMESSLQLLADYDGEIIDDKEQIDIEYKFILGDIVKVAGYGADLFIIIGFRTEIWRSKENAWEDVIYELSRMIDGEWLEVGEDEMTLVADAEQAEAFLQKHGLLSLSNQKEKLPKMIEQNRSKTSSFRKAETDKLEHLHNRKNDIDTLLDLYNDYQTLYKMFKDEEYAYVMALVRKKLAQVVQQKEKY